MSTFSMKELIILFVVAGTLFLGIPIPAEAGQNIRCESEGGKRHYCRIGVHGAVSLQRQLSNAVCIQGRTWGDDGDGIWVSGGCRAEFWIDDIPNYNNNWVPGGGNSYGGSANGNIRCESQGGKRNYCGTFTGGGVHLVRQLSRSECVYQRTWGYDSGGIWVSNGCRAEFGTSGGNWGGGSTWDNNSGGNSIRCGSQGGKRNYCPVDTRGGVSMKQQLSHSACIQSQSWGYDSGGIWVSNGCRAEFRIGNPGHHSGHRHHDNTAAVAAGALVLGALVAVAASDSKDHGNTTVSSHGVNDACMEAIRQKVTRHYGDQTVIKFKNMSRNSISGHKYKVEGKAGIQSQGRSWTISFQCKVKASGNTSKVLEAHILD